MVAHDRVVAGALRLTVVDDEDADAVADRTVVPDGREPRVTDEDAELVVIRHVVRDDDVRGLRVADVEPGLTTATGDAVRDRAAHRVEAGDAVLRVVDGAHMRDAQVGAAEREDAFSGEVFDLEAADRHPRHTVDERERSRVEVCRHDADADDVSACGANASRRCGRCLRRIGRGECGPRGCQACGRL